MNKTIRNSLAALGLIGALAGCAGKEIKTGSHDEPEPHLVSTVNNPDRSTEYRYSNGTSGRWAIESTSERWTIESTSERCTIEQIENSKYH